jgi:hypothetical protein
MRHIDLKAQYWVTRLLELDCDFEILEGTESEWKQHTRKRSVTPRGHGHAPRNPGGVKYVST